MRSFSSILSATLAAVGVLAAPAAEPHSSHDAPNFLVARGSSTTGTNGGYFYLFWTDGGAPVTYENGPGGSYSVSWKTGGNFVAGKGWQTGSPRTVTYSGTWELVDNGNAYLSIYGWAKKPTLVEWYITENHGNYNPASAATHMGSVTTDGSVYDLYEDTRFMSDSIEGTQTFNQYWAVRQDKRVGGSVNTKNIFDAWAKVGMDLDDFDCMVVATEGYYSASTSNITVY